MSRELERTERSGIRRETALLRTLEQYEDFASSSLCTKGIRCSPGRFSMDYGPMLTIAAEGDFDGVARAIADPAPGPAMVWVLGGHYAQLAPHSARSRSCRSGLRRDNGGASLAGAWLGRGRWAPSRPIAADCRLNLYWPWRRRLPTFGLMAQDHAAVRCPSCGKPLRLVQTIFLEATPGVRK